MSGWYQAEAAVLVALLASACSSDSGSGTAGQAITLKTKINIKDDLKQSKSNALGWDVSISKAHLSVGALYYYSGDPVLSQRLSRKSPSRNALARLSDLFVKPAFAHPGHYIEGAAMGQMLTPTTVDLLAGEVSLADGEGVTGDTNSARFTWQSPPQGELSAALEGHVISATGTATKGDTTLQFIAQVDEPDVHDGDDKAEVAGCAFGSGPGLVGVTMDGNGTVTLTLVPSVWFDQVDFSYVVPGASGAPTPNADGAVDLAGTLAWQGFMRGVKKGTAYEFSYSK